jgi:lysophospholipase L1-like esterase
MADAPKILGTDTLKNAYPKLNSAIDNSNEALTKSATAETNSVSAVNTSNAANTTSNGTQTQLNNIIIASGTSDAETIQARGTFPILNDRFNSVETSLAESMNLSNGFFQKILSTTTKIKLIGDSITEGVGASGHSVPIGNPIIFDNGTEVYREGDYTCRCWANYFREYIGAHYPNVTSFINAGIGGKSTRWAMTDTNKESWVNANEDLVFVMLGMNDRSLGDFKTNITQFLAYVKARSTNMIVMIPTPTLNDDPALNVEVRTINDTIVKVCQENGYFYISHYIDMLDYCQTSGVELSSLVQNDGGSHPIDNGYLWMWTNIQKRLKFVDIQDVYTSRAKVSYLKLDFATSVSALSVFPKGVSYFQTFQNINGFPYTLSGTVKTYKAVESNDYSWQEFIDATNKFSFKRIWKTATNTWTSWKLSTHNDLAINFAVSTKLIADFPFGVSYCIMQSLAGYGLPNDIGGLIITYKVQDTNQYNYQEFFEYGTNAKFIRNVQADGTWGVWKGVTTKVITKSLTFPAISTMAVNGQTVNAGITFDTTKYAYIVSPKSVLDTTLFFSYSIQNGGTTLYVRLLNTGGVSITPGNLEFDLTIIRK